MMITSPFSRETKNRIKIGSRKCTDRPPKHLARNVAMAACACFVLMCLTAALPHQVEEAETVPNEGMQLAFTGDTVFSRYIGDIAEGSSYGSLLEGVEGLWSEADYVFTNLEYAILVEGEESYAAEKKDVSFPGTTASLDALLDAGFNVFSIANNHSSDYGQEAFDDEIAYMYGLGLDFAGYYLGADDAPEYDGTLLAMYGGYQGYVSLECSDGTTAGFIAAVDPATSSTSLCAHALKTSTPELYAYVNDSAMENDLTIVYLHCGAEYTINPQGSQEELARNMVDAGADIVIQTHSHTLMPVEFYNGGIIFYGLGNLLMDQYQTATRDGVVVLYNRPGSGGGYFELVPVRSNSGYAQVTGSRYYKNRICRTLTKRLDGDDYYISSDGHVIIPWG